LIEYQSAGNIRCLDDILGTVTLAKHSAGLLQTYRFIVEKELKNGDLIEVLRIFRHFTPIFFTLSIKKTRIFPYSCFHRFSA
jgi:hypothetical protein